MINKEEIEKAKERLKGLRNYRRTYSGSMWFNVTTQLDIEGKETIDIVLQYISDLEKELENYKTILAGKSIQEMGLSNLYGGTEDEKQ